MIKREIEHLSATGSGVFSTFSRYENIGRCSNRKPMSVLAPGEGPSRSGFEGGALVEGVEVVC